jgi:soluble lytic murein transglycosylase-like protein
MYANGRGVARDDTLAAYFFALAAKLDHPQAKRMLRYVGEPLAEVPECMRPPPPPGPDLSGQDLLTDLSPAQRRVADLVLKIAPEYGVHPRLAFAVIRTESNFNHGAVSPKSAQGLMQLIPETAARFNVKKPFDPEQNIRGGLAYLRWLLAYFTGDVTLVAAAYNAGEGAVNRYLGVPPYAETRGYVKRIYELYQREAHPFDASVTEPSVELPRILAKKSG